MFAYNLLVHLNDDEINGYMCEYSNDGVGRSFMLSTNHWYSNKLNIN